MTKTEGLILHGIFHIINLLLCFFRAMELGILPEMSAEAAKNYNNKLANYLLEQENAKSDT